MTEPELLALVETYAADPAAWADRVRHDAEERTFVLLQRDDETEVWLVCWAAGHDTGFHDHDGSAAAVLVARGAIREERLGLSGASGQEYRAGEALLVEPSAIHRVLHAGAAPAVTIHAYSPPLRRMGRYAVRPDGRLERYAQDSETALEPVA
jgi:quercetin dioxygenase-like cupin family protein